MRGLVAAVLAVACGPPEPVRIGVVVGEDGMLGARFAEDSINRAGGIRGRPLELMVFSGQWLTSAEAALRAADSLTRVPGVLAVVGHANSSASLAASQVYNSTRVVQVAPNSTSPLYRAAGPYSYRLVGSDAQQASFLVDELRRRGAPRTAVFFVNDDYGRPLRDSVVAHAAAARVPIVLETPYSELENFADAEAVIAQLVRARPELILWLGRALDLKRVLDAARGRLNVPVLASDGIGVLCCVTDSMRRALQGVAFVRLVNPHNADPAFQALRTRYMEATGDRGVTDQAALTFDAVLLLAAAIQQEGADREGIRRYLDALGRGRPRFRGVTGTIAFDSAGDALASYHLDTVRSTLP